MTFIFKKYIVNIFRKTKWASMLQLLEIFCFLYTFFSEKNWQPVQIVYSKFLTFFHPDYQNINIKPTFIFR